MACRYVPLFNYFDEQAATAFRVLADDYVTDDSGTGMRPDVEMLPLKGGRKLCDLTGVGGRG